MGIIGNKTLLHKLPLNQIGGAFASDIATKQNWHVKENASKLASVPNGYYAGGAWILPQKSGEITAINGLLGNHLFIVSNLAAGLNAESSIFGSGDITNANLNSLAFLTASLTQSNSISANLVGSVNIASNLVGSGNLNGALGALVSIIADLNGAGELTPNIAGAVSIVSNLSGSGNIDSAIKATISIISNLVGTSDLTSAIIGNWNMVGNLLGSNNLTAGVDAKAYMSTNILNANSLTLNNGAVAGFMTSNITSLSELSPENLASSVWSALASQYNQSGTMGEKLNGAGSAGNPWTEIIEGTYTAKQILQLLSSAAIGKSTIINNGDNTATVIFRDLEDTVDRITGEMEGSERKNIDLIL